MERYRWREVWVKTTSIERGYSPLETEGFAHGQRLHPGTASGSHIAREALGGAHRGTLPVLVLFSYEQLEYQRRATIIEFDGII